MGDTTQQMAGSTSTRAPHSQCMNAGDVEQEKAAIYRNERTERTSLAQLFETGGAKPASTPLLLPSVLSRQL